MVTARRLPHFLVALVCATAFNTVRGDDGDPIVVALSAPSTTTTSTQAGAVPTGTVGASTAVYAHKQPSDLSIYGFASLAITFRTALVGDASVSLLRGATSLSPQWDSTATITQFVPLIVTGSFCLLMALLIVFITPCLALGYWRDVRRRRRMAQAEMENERDLLVENKTPEDERAAKQRRKLQEEEEKAANRVYSREERVFAVSFLLLSSLMVILCLVYGFAGNSVANNAFVRFSNITQLSLRRLETLSYAASGAVVSTSGLSAAQQFSAALPTVDTSDFDAAVYARSTANTALLTQQYRDLQQMVGWYIANLTAARSAADRVGTTVSALLAAGGSSGSARNIMVRTYTSIGGDGPCNFGLTAFNSLPAVASPLDSTAVAGVASNAQTSAVSYNLTLNAAAISQAQSALISWSDAYMLDAVKNSVGNYSTTMPLVAPVAAGRVPTIMRNARNGANYNLAWAASYNTFRSNLTYAGLVMATMSVLATVSLIMVRQTHLAAGVNVFSFALVGLFWVLCIMAITYSVVDAHFCREIRPNQQLASWIPFLQNRLNYTNPTYTLNLTSYVPQLYAARDACYAGDPAPLQAAIGQLSAAASTTPQNYSTAAAEQLRSTFGAPSALADALVSPNVGTSFDTLLRQRLKSLYDVVRANLNTVQHTGYANFAQQIYFGNYGAMLNLATLPVSFDPRTTATTTLTNAINALVPTAPIYATGGGGTNPAGSQCSSELRSLQAPKLVAEVASLVTNLTLAVTAAQSDLLTYATNANSLSTSIAALYTSAKQTWDAASTDTSAADSLNVRTTALTFFRSSVLPVVSAIQSPLRASFTDCRDLAAWTYEAEDLTCAVAQTGLDALLWAMGALGVLHLLQVVAVRMCVARVGPNSKWLVIALLLERQYNTVSLGNNQTMIRRTPRTNATGTTYLTEGDLDIEFNDAGRGGGAAPPPRQ